MVQPLVFGACTKKYDIYYLRCCCGVARLGVVGVPTVGDSEGFETPARSWSVEGEKRSFAAGSVLGVKWKTRVRHAAEPVN